MHERGMEGGLIGGLIWFEPIHARRDGHVTITLQVTLMIKLIMKQEKEKQTNDDQK